jgi:hypothetical protein
LLQQVGMYLAHKLPPRDAGKPGAQPFPGVLPAGSAYIVMAGGNDFLGVSAVMLQMFAVKGAY